MSYIVNFTQQAKEGLSLLKKNEPLAFKKASKLLLELYDHPRTGTGQVEQLRHLENTWSRRISKKHRLVYSVDDEKITVLVISAIGHYDDK